MRHTVLKLFLPACVSLVVLGCWGYRPDLPPTERVTGTVTLDGEPIAGARVQFVPDKSKGTEGAMASGVTDEQGQYELETARVKGAIVGFHKIGVEARAQPRDQYDTLPELLTPERYADHNTSGLTAEVTAGEKNQIDLPLTSAP